MTSSCTSTIQFFSMIWVSLKYQNFIENMELSGGKYSYLKEYAATECFETSTLLNISVFSSNESYALLQMKCEVLSSFLTSCNVWGTHFFAHIWSQGSSLLMQSLLLLL